MVYCVRSVRAALLVGAAALLPAGGWAQVPVPASAQSGTADVIRVLLDQAAYWRSKTETGLANEALSRVLALDPGNVDALAAQAQAGADRGDKAAARSALARLQATRPEDPRIASIQQTLNAPPLDQTALAEAQGFAAGGKPADAVAAYRRAFHSTVPPPAQALDYFVALNAVEGNWDEAREGLAGVVRSDPQNLNAQLAYAQAMTYHEGTRADGIDRLIALASIPEVADKARVSWREAMLWSGDDERTKQRLTTYLQRFPGDPQLDAKRAEIQSTTPDDATLARLAGYQALESKRLAEAEKDFKAALALNGRDGEAMVMLASIRRVQGREPEVQQLLAEARSVDPDRAGDLIKSVGLDVGRSAPQFGAIGGTGDGGASIRRAYVRVQSLTQHGEFALAETELRKLMGARPPPAAFVQLGYIQLQAGRLRDAETSFRRVLAANPKDRPALQGLGAALAREGRGDEASVAYASGGLPGPGAPAAASRSTALREQAQAATDPQVRIGLLRQAVEVNSADPWLRLELARALVEQGKAGDARQVMDPVTGAARPTTDQLRSSIYFAETTDNYPLAATLVQQLPPKARTADLQRVEQRGLAEADLRDARSAGSVAAVRQRMLSLAVKPDPTGARGAAFAQELIHQGDKTGARDVIRSLLNAQATTPQQRIAYSGALVAAGYPRDASVVSALVQAGRLSTAERRDLASVQNSAAVVASDQLNGSGEAAQAYDQLAPRLARDPQNADLNLALARLYASQRNPGRAAAISEEVARRDPTNAPARITTLYAAWQAGETERAGRLAAELKQQFPEDPQAFVAAANVERARGEEGQALRDLRRALALRNRQLSSSNGGARPSSPGA